VLEKLKIHAKQLKKEIVSLYFAYRRKDTPVGAKIVAAIVVAYALSPIDLIPDFVPLLGYLDDLILLPLGIALAVKLIPEPIMNQCRQEAEGLFKKNLPKSWKAGSIIVLFWIVIVVLLFQLFI